MKSLHELNFSFKRKEHTSLLKDQSFKSPADTRNILSTDLIKRNSEVNRNQMDLLENDVDDDIDSNNSE